MNFNEHAEVMNGPETYRATAQLLKEGSAVQLAWIDETGTKLDVIFCLPVRIGAVNASYRFVVSVLTYGCYCFNSEPHPVYVSEKLGLHGPTAIKLAELIGGVMGRLTTTGLF